MRISVATITFLCLLAHPSFAALATTVQWDIRTTGAPTNGGCYDHSVSVPGTDWSQQNGAHQAYTDIVIGGTVTQATSAAHPFGATDVGNCVQITAGVGCNFTTNQLNGNFFEILSVSGVTATFDRSLGAGASTCSGNLGGSLSSITDTAAIFTAGTTGTYNIKSGTYAYTSMWDPCHGTCATTFLGYNSTHGDGGTCPLLTTATNSNSIFRQEGETWSFNNVCFSNTAATSAPLFLSNDGGGDSFYFQKCVFDGFSTVATAVSNTKYMVMLNSEVKNATSTGIETYWAWILSSSIHGTTGAGIQFDGTTTTPLVVEGSIIYGQTGLSGRGIAVDGSVAHPVWATRNVFYNNSAGGITGGANLVLTAANNVLYGNTGYGIDAAGGFLIEFNNAFGANTTASCNGCTLNSTDVALSADPFVNAALANFALNSTAGGGAALKAAGFPGTLISGGTGYIDIGALQSQATIGATTPIRNAPLTGGVQ